VTSEEFVPWILPGAFLGIMASLMLPVLVRATLKRRARVRALEALARRLGFRFRRGPDERGVRELPGLEGNLIWPPMDTLNTIEGHIDLSGRRVEARLGDCISRLNTKSFGDDELSRAMVDPREMRSYAAVRLPTIVVPDVVIVPRDGEIAGVLGLEEVRLELDAFNRVYQVLSSTPRFAYDILHPRAMELLMSGPQLRIVVGRGWCMALPLKRALDTQELEAALRMVASFVASWPAHVMSDLDEMAPRRP
jgi:hypothetical protein